MARDTKRRMLVRALPWAVAIGVAAFLLSRYSLGDIAREMAKGDVVALLLPMLVMMTVSICLVAAGDLLVLRSTVVVAPRFWDLIRGRAATSILMLLGYVFSGGGLAVWIARKTKIPAGQTIGLLAYIMFSELAALSIIASVAVWLGGGELIEAQLRTVVLWVAPAIALSVVAAGLIGPRLLAPRLADPQLLRAVTRVPASAFVLNLLLRTLHLSNVILCKIWALRAFGLDIPVSALWTYMPVILLVGALPVNVLGFGAIQVVWLVFERWAPGEAILAYVFLWQLLFVIALVIRGLPFVRRVIAEIAGETAPATESASADSGGADPPAAG